MSGDRWNGRWPPDRVRKLTRGLAQLDGEYLSPRPSLTVTGGRTDPTSTRHGAATQKPRAELPHRGKIATPQSAQQPLIDSALWAAALAFATIAANDFRLASININRLAIAIAIAIVMQLGLEVVCGLLWGRWRRGSFEEVRWLAISAGLTTIMLFTLGLMGPRPRLVPLDATLAAGAYQLFGVLVVRYSQRIVYQARRRSNHHRSERMLIFGAGQIGSDAARELLEDTQTDLLPVAFLDDDPTKYRLRLHGLPVAGTRYSIKEAADTFGAKSLLIAMPSIPRSSVAVVADLAQAAGLSVRILPRLDYYLANPVRVRDIREMTLADFLTRDEIRLDLEQISSYLAGKVVLVTGAGGSIGSQLCETIRRFDPSRIVMVDNSEGALHAVQLRLQNRALLDSPDLLLADIRDASNVLDLFREVRPQVVFHAAAYKHLTFLERFPTEGVRTNVAGTLNILKAADDVGVETFVNISTDKAADPTSVLGATKRVAEMLTAGFGLQNGSAFMSVRFGNVLGSNGSVIPILHDQIVNGVPLTITHPEVTRFFMTTEEAVQLVLQAGAIGKSGDVLVLDMGQPVKIVDLARRLAAQIDPTRLPDIDYTGLRPGEKLHETLSSRNDVMLGRPHELILRFAAPSLAPSALDALLYEEDGYTISECLWDLIEDGSFVEDRGSMTGSTEVADSLGGA